MFHRHSKFIIIDEGHVTVVVEAQSGDSAPTEPYKDLFYAQLSLVDVVATKLGWLQSSKVVMYRQFIQSRDISSEVAWPVSLYHVQAREMSQGWATKFPPTTFPPVQQSN